MNSQNLTFTQSNTVAESEHFRSLCESTAVKVSANAAPDAVISYTLLAINSRGDSFTVYHKSLPANENGAVSLLHEFDPISLAVYQDAVEFFVRIEGDFSNLFLTLTENEQIAQMLQEGKRRRSEKKREPHPLKKVLFVGNSILLGFECLYGMCASSPENDYAYHVSGEIRNVYPSCEFFKVHGSPIEHAESMEAFEEAFRRTPNVYTGKPFCESLTSDLDLVILQMTDNVNTEKKVETFSKSAELLLQRVHAACPNAVILWVYGWYHKPALFPRMLELFEQYDVEPVDLRGCRCKANEASVGHQYRAADGTIKIAKDAWITHPGDGGMRAIADQIISTLRSISILPS